MERGPREKLSCVFVIWIASSLKCETSGDKLQLPCVKIELGLKMSGSEIQNMDKLSANLKSPSETNASFLQSEKKVSFNQLIQIHACETRPKRCKIFSGATNLKVNACEHTFV